MARPAGRSALGAAPTAPRVAPEAACSRIPWVMAAPELSPVDYVLRASGTHIFERQTPREPYGYKLVMPGVMIGAEELEFSYADGVYTATQTDAGRTWTGTASYHQAAILALIADRMGFTATIEPKPEPEDDEA